MLKKLEMRNDERRAELWDEIRRGGLSSRDLCDARNDLRISDKGITDSMLRNFRRSDIGISSRANVLDKVERIIWRAKELK